MMLLLKKIWAFAGKLINGRYHPVMKIGAIVFLGLILINCIYYFASAYNPGCVMCHYMKPYFEQSDNSVHKDVSCVTCHPSRRILTAPYLLRYIAGSYNPRPRAEVDDKVCIKCHEEQDLKKGTAFEMNISFNHSDHLSDLKRGKKLRCTSCHARGEYEQHFEINKNVCFTCHFKGAETGHSSTECNVCHGFPVKTVEHGGFKFNHESYLKIGVDCSQCHLDVTNGNAEVEKKRCYQCHVERTEEFSNSEKIHDVHISKRGVDCEECHNEIQHGKVKMINTLEANCENCHQLRHTPQREMYIGSEGRGVGSISSRMFAAQVSCEGCHVDLNNDGKSDMNERRQSCVNCHSQGYDKMLDKWVSGIDESVKAVEPAFEQTRQLLNSEKARGKNIEGLQTFFKDAEANFNLVKEGRGVHNIDYALKLLLNVASNLEGINEKIGNKNFRVNKSRLMTDDNEYCNLCHFVIPSKNINKFASDDFPHAEHMKFTQCTKCHSRDEHRKITATKETCESCHKNFSSVPENIRYKSILFSHKLHTSKSNISCKVCHVGADFSRIQIKNNVCSGCHHKDEQSKNCVNCHPLQNNTYIGNILSGKHDPDIMSSAGTQCNDCHNPSKTSIIRPKDNFCASCHDASYTSMKDDWIKEIRTKSSEISSLISSIDIQDVSDEEKQKIQGAKSLVSLIKSDGSKGLHNYLVLSSLLDRSIKEIKEIANRQ
jgi:Class III cytochrome C family